MVKILARIKFLFEANLRLDATTFVGKFTYVPVHDGMAHLVPDVKWNKVGTPAPACECVMATFDLNDARKKKHTDSLQCHLHQAKCFSRCIFGKNDIKWYGAHVVREDVEHIRFRQSSDVINQKINI